MRDRLPLEGVLARPHLAVATALLVLTGLAWIHLLTGPPMTGSGAAHLHAAASALMNPALRSWGAPELAAAFAMWLVMAVAMMLPTAAPAILAFADICGNAEDTLREAGRTGAFVAGYLSVWLGFGLAATGVQWLLATQAVQVPGLRSDGLLVGGVLLLIAGLYQFSALKNVCLTKCRSPLTYFLAHWREGYGGAFRLGAGHGVHCVGCCWALMALMLFAGTMNVAWTAALAALMLAEKVVPGGPAIGRAVGMGLIAWGGALLVRL